MEELEAFLKHIGFTEYEARSYVTLLKHGTLTADKVSTMGGIPLPRVYDTMLSLSNRGLIITSSSRPQTFKAVDSRQLMNIIKESEKKKAEEKMKSIEDMTPHFNKLISALPKNAGGVREREEIIAHVQSKANVDKLWDDLQENVSNEVFIFAGDISWISKRFSNIKSMVRDNIDYRILFCSSNGEALRNSKRALKTGAQIKFSEDYGNLRGIICDGRKVFIIQKSVYENHTGSTSTTYRVIFISDKTIADVFRKYFLSLWNKSDTKNKSAKHATK